jgi:pyridoxine 5-phosphate synthase
MTRLSVNINKIATLRNARGGNIPNLVRLALDIEDFGADGITVHPRPDERHIRYQDVYDLKGAIRTEFNIEGYPSERFIKLVLDVKPAQVTLVPDPPGVLTSDTGWDALSQRKFLTNVVKTFKSKGIRTSCFMNAELDQIREVAQTGVDRIELYTGPYAEQYPVNKESAIAKYLESANLASELGMGINAGHDLNLDNLAYFNRVIEDLDEVSIGHALISDALYFGMENTVNMYKACLREKE